MIGPRPQRHAAGRLFLLRELVRRDLQGDATAGSTLGFFWSFAQPLAQVLLLIVRPLHGDPRPGGQPLKSHAGFAARLFAGLLP